MKTSKKQIVKKLKQLLDEHRARIERYGFKFVNSKGDSFKQEPLYIDREGVTYNKPYACRLFVDIKYTKKSWSGGKK